MCSKVLCAILSIGLVAQSCVCQDGTRPRSSHRLDVFAKISDGPSSSPNNTLSVPGLQRFSDMLMTQLTCAENTGGNNNQGNQHNCQKFMCLNTTNLVSHTNGLDPDDVISKEQFEDVSVILLDLIASVDDLGFCHKVINSSALSTVRSRQNLLEDLLEIVDGKDHISGTKVTQLLQKLKGMQVKKEPTSNGKSGDKRGANEAGGHSSKDQHAKSGHNSEGNGHSSGHGMDEAAHLVVESKCLSLDSLLYYLGVDNGNNFPVSSLPQLASLITYTLKEEAVIKDKCRLLPNAQQFTDPIFSTYGGASGTIDRDGMKSLMTKVGIGKDVKSEEGGDHHDDHHRRRRILRTELTNQSRRKRDASVPDDVKVCYSAEQLMALYDSPMSVDEATFKEMCPALLSQKLFAECGSEEHHSESDSELSDLEIYGYGSIAIFLICASSFFGMLFLPCVSQRVYNTMMSIFVGLAMGTLFADAILHLIPMAMGIHVHGPGHDHHHSSGKIVIEEHVRIGLCIMGCLYGFYLLEVFITKYGGNSSLLAKSGSDEFTQMDVIADKLKCEGHLEDSNEEIVSKDTSSGILSEIVSLPPLALMVVLGDAVHNFADGLAVAAAFSVSITSGVATSIAIFCHELPHELGDFAVLLQSGCSFKKAFVLNLISALTAFVGLYVGIQVATTQSTQSYIFAAAAAMFIYISLVDLLPEITRTRTPYHIFLNNCGILLGYAILFVIAITEEHIKI